MTKVQLSSSGKSEVGKMDCDLYIDCRGITNPFRDPVMGKLHGSDPQLIKWMEEQNPAYIEAALSMIDKAIETRPTRNSGKDPEKPLRVRFFCLAGQHRSPAMKMAVLKRLSIPEMADSIQVVVTNE